MLFAAGVTSAQVKGIQHAKLTIWHDLCSSVNADSSAEAKAQVVRICDMFLESAARHEGRENLKKALNILNSQGATALSHATS